MDMSRRTCAAASAAALSAAVVAGMIGTVLAFDDVDCADLTHHEAIRTALGAGARLAGSTDGVACESLPHRPSWATDPAVGNPLLQTSTAPTPVTTPHAAPAKLVTGTDSAVVQVAVSGGVTTGGTPSP